MTDTVSCQNCGTSLPAGAAFCTNCGTKLEAAGTGESGAATSQSPTSAEEDATRVDTPGLQDATRVLPAAPAAAAAGSQDATEVFAPAAPAWTPPPVPSQPSWQPPPPPAPPPGAWEPPPPPQPEWAKQAPPAGQPWSAPAVPTAPPSQWQQPTASTNAAASAAATPTRESTGGLAAAIAFVGAIVLLIGVFTLWLQTAQGSSVKLTGWEMVTKGNDARPFDSPDPAILLGIAAAAIAIGGLLVAGKNRLLLRILLALAGIGAVVVLVRDYLSIKDAVKHTFSAGTTIDFQYGFWIAAAGAVILIIAAVVPPRRQNEPAR